MATCNYATYVGGPCGGSHSNPANSACVLIADCTKNIKRHLTSLNCFDSTLKDEKKLLLARAGTWGYFISLILFLSRKCFIFLAEPSDVNQLEFRNIVLFIHDPLYHHL